MGIPQYGTVPRRSGDTPSLVPYLNVLQGIRMDYPGTWTVQEQSSPLQFTAWFGSPQQGPQDVFQENLTVAVQPVFAGTTQADFVDGWQAVASQMRLEILEAADASIAGQNAYRVVFRPPQQQPNLPAPRVELYLFVIGPKGYTVTYTGLGSDLDLFLPAVQRMLASLQVR